MNGEFVMPSSLYTLSAYEDVTPLCEKGHVMLVRNVYNGNLYVKKQIQCYDPEIYFQLKKYHIKHIPEIYEIFEGESSQESDGTNVVIIEEYFTGSTIAECLMEKGIFSEKDALSIAMKLCQILIDLHDLKPAMIHRDIKPSNVMLLSDGTVKLLDFNAAKLENTDGSRDTVLLGTAGFAAPEQYGFSASSRQTDIYAVGVLLNTMLTGTLPAEKIAGGKLRRIIRCCLELNPKDRYRDMRELYSELKRMSKVKAEWLPPGFRTLRVHKMLPALAVYVGLFWFFMTFEYKSIEEPGEEIVIKCGFIAVFYLMIFFYGNYLNMKKYFPFMRSPKKSLRIFGRILAPFLIAWVVFMVAVTIVVLFVQ